MKRNLLYGITILMGAVALSSCSELNQLAKTEYTGDDVYFTKAQAGDSFDYSSMYTQANTTNTRNDDYYYYGDYQTRINRFGYSSPFAYDYDYYYDYNPYANNFGYGFGGINQAPMYDYAYSPFYDMGVYSAYDFGYGNYWGVGNYGYGNIYSMFIGGGGVSTRSRIKTYPSAGVVIGNVGSSNSGGLAFKRGGTSGSATTALQNGLSFSRGSSVSNLYPNSRQTVSSTVYPGRPITATAQNGAGTTRATNQAVRPATENPRTYTPPPAVQRSAPPAQSSGGGSSGSSSSSGGGGRPVRP